MDKFCYGENCANLAIKEKSKNGLYFCSDKCKASFQDFMYPVQMSVDEKLKKIIVEKDGEKYSTVSCRKNPELLQVESLQYKPGEITVVCNFYKRIKNIEKQLQTIAKQTYNITNLWICIFDSPFSAEIIKRVKQFHENNMKGVKLGFFTSDVNLRYHGRFSIAMYADTEFVYIVDDDVFVYPTFLTDAIHTLTVLPNAGEVGTVGFEFYRNPYGEIDWDRQFHVDWDFGSLGLRGINTSHIPKRADMLIRHRVLRTKDLHLVFENFNNRELFRSGEDIYLGHMLKFKLNKPPFIIQGENRVEMNEGELSSTTLGNEYNLFFRRRLLYDLYQQTLVKQNITCRKYAVVIFTRNDNIGGDNKVRALICLNSWTEVVEQVVLVDIASPGIKLYDELEPSLTNKHKITNIQISIEQWNRVVKPGMEPLYQTKARNIGIRAVASDVNVVIMSNVDIIPPTREELDSITITDNSIYIIPRIDVKNTYVYDQYSKLNGDYYKLKKVLDDNKEYGFIESDFENTTSAQENIYINQNPVSHSYQITMNDKWLLSMYGKENVKRLAQMSKIRNVGDFQMISKKSCYKLKGFEEGMNKHFGSDTNFMIKCWNAGLEHTVCNNVRCYHMSHGKRSGHSVEMNDHNKFVFNYRVITTNDKNWGKL